MDDLTPNNQVLNLSSKNSSSNSQLNELTNPLNLAAAAVANREQYNQYLKSNIDSMMLLNYAAAAALGAGLPPQQQASTSNSSNNQIAAAAAAAAIPNQAALAAAAAAAATMLPPQSTQFNSSSTFKPNQTRYQQLLSVIEEMGKDIRTTYMGNKNSVERLKRGIASARILVKDCLIECERNTKNP